MAHTIRLFDANGPTMPLPGGAPGNARSHVGHAERTAATLQAMRGVAHAAAESAIVRDFAREFGLASASVSAPPGIFSTLLYGLMNLVKFRPDPDGVELLRHPAEMLEEIRESAATEGDCDDLAMLAAALALAAGRRPAFIVVARRPAPAPYEHVYYGLVDAAGTLVPFDPQQRTPPGRFTPGARQTLVVHV